MKKLLLSFAISLSSIVAINAQEKERNTEENTTFVKQINDISYDIDLIIKKNKELLKKDLNDIEIKLENNELTKLEADSSRIAKAEFYAKKIENETKLEENKISQLINEKIENNIHFGSDMSVYQKKLIENKVLFGLEYYFGHGALLVDGKSKNDYYDNNFISSFGFGIGAKTRVGKETSNWYWKSTIDFNFLFSKIKNNKTFESINGETVLIDLDFPVDRSRINILNYNWTNYIEYDFSKPKYDEFGNPIKKSRQSFYIGAGATLGYSQVNRFLRYEKNGEKHKETTNAKFNANHFTYGIGAYVGYQNISLRGTYNINNVFKKSFADHNTLNISLVLELL